MTETTRPHKRTRIIDEISGDADIWKILFDPNTQNFKAVRRFVGFVDHTLLNALFFGSGPAFLPMKLFISAPSHFCKSSNMNMIQKFYGRGDTNELPDIRLRKWYETFEGTEIMKNPDVSDKINIGHPQILSNQGNLAHSTLLDNHFCAHPVIFVDFKTFLIKSYWGAVAHCFEIISGAYEEHKVFLEDNLREGRHKNICQVWWKAVVWKNLADDNDSALNTVCNGLKDLVACLFEAHKKKRVLVLVDECDAIVSAALSCMVPEEPNGLKAIAELMEEILGKITKGDDIESKLQGVLLTGISYVHGCGYSRMIKTTPCKFLDDTVGQQLNQDDEAGPKGFGQLLVQFYGLHEDQVHNLIKNLERNKMLKGNVEEVKQAIKEKFNGYYTRRGASIYSLWTVLHFLRDGYYLDTDACMSNIGYTFKKAFRHRDVGKDVLDLVQGCPIRVKFNHSFDLKILVNLRDSGVKRKEERCALLSLLMEMGFLTNVKQKPRKEAEVELKLPNEAITKIFIKMCVHHEIEIGPFHNNIMNNCAETFRLLSECLDNDDLLKECLNSLYDNLTKLFEGLNVYRNSELSECLVQALLWTTLMHDSETFKVIPEFVTEDNKRIDLWVNVENGKCIYVCELKLNRVDDIEHSSMYALKEITGEQSRIVKGKETYKTYLGELKRQEVKNYLLLGLSVNKFLKPSLSVQTSKSNRKIVVSKSEPKLPYYTNYYIGCLDWFKDEVV